MVGNEIRDAASARGLSDETLRKIIRNCGLENKNWFGNTHDQTKNLTDDETRRALTAIREYRGSSRKTPPAKWVRSHAPAPGFVAIFDPERMDYMVGSCSSDGEVPTYTIQTHLGHFDSDGIREAIRKCRNA